MGEDETQRIHKRISDLSLAVIVTSIALVLLTCAVCLINLDDTIEELGRIF